MASVIHATAHGLVAGSRIKFGNIIPTDTGIDEATPYYVLASGLTANDFQFSEEAGGTAFILAYDITDGVIINDVTYEETVLIGPGLITETHIAPDSISTPMLKANVVTADKLAAILVIASKFMTAESGRRGEFDQDGFRLYEADGTILVNMPTDDTPVYFNAQVQASALEILAGATIRGPSELAAGSVTTLASGISNPSAAPALVASYPAINFDRTLLDAGGTLDDLSRGMDFESGGAYMYQPRSRTGDLLSYDKIDPADGSVVASYDTAFDLTPTAPARTYQIAGVAVTASRVWILVWDFGGTGTTWLLSYTKDSTTLTASADITADMTGGAPCLFYDAGNTKVVVVTHTGTGAGVHARFRKYDPGTLSLSSTLDATGDSLTGSQKFNSGATLSGEYWISDQGNLQPRAYNNSTGALVSNKEWGTGDIRGIAHDGTVFWYRTSLGAGANNVYETTNWTWTTESAIYWVTYSWYDSAGTTHESQGGPRNSITMKRRQKLTVTCAPLPGAGGADDPDNHRIYIKPNATDPGLTNFKLQATTVGDTTVLTTYDSGGAADPSSNGFAALGTPAILQSTGAGFQIKGSGLIDFGGTAFPASPTIGDHFFRTNLLSAGGWFRYDGTQWRSVEVFELLLGASTGSIAATTNNLGWAPLDLHGGSDAYLLDAVAFIFVNTGGSALDASNKWVFTTDKGVDSSATLTTIATSSLASGANGSRKVTTAINALANSGTVHAGFRYNATKTGTPGAIFPNLKISYQVVAT